MENNAGKRVVVIGAGIVGASLAYHLAGLRPMPVDGIPIIGYLPDMDGVYVCAMHPGVTLAAIVGRLASEEIVDDKVSPALESCRPERFSKSRIKGHGLS